MTLEGLLDGPLVVLWVVQATALLAVVDVFTGDAQPTPYFLPLGLADPALAEVPGEVVARHGDLVVRDAIADPDTCRALLRGMLDGRTLSTALGGRFIFKPVERPAAGGVLPGDSDIASMAIRHAGVTFRGTGKTRLVIKSGSKQRKAPKARKSPA